MKLLENIDNLILSAVARAQFIPPGMGQGVQEARRQAEQGAFGQLDDLFNFGLLFTRGQDLTVARLVNWGIQIFLMIAAIAAFIYLLIAGFQYITAGGDSDKATKARTGILNAIIGIIVILLAFGILMAITRFAEVPR